jgi:hypothetical protein
MIATVHFTSIELALLAKYNLEMADSYDEVAEDPELRVETRHTARESASRHRERAEVFQSEAQRFGAYPNSVTERTTQEQPSSYSGPERRNQERRIRDRRGPQSLAPGDVDFADRRSNHDRR